MPRLAIGEHELVPLQPGDAGDLAELCGTGDNVLLLSPDLFSTAQAEAIIQALRTSLWAFPMRCTAGGRTAGVCYTTQADVGNLNARIGALFREPDRASELLARYLQLLFWSYPIHRLFVQVPTILGAYVDLYLSVGFQREGLLRDHLWVNGAGVDVATLGLLRADFVSWAAAGDGRFAL